MSEGFTYKFQVDATSVIAMALLLFFFVLVPYAVWSSFLQPLWAVGGIEGWIMQGGKDPSANPRLKERTAPIMPRSALLSFANVHYTVKLPGRKEPLHVLKGVSGVLRPGTLTAIMGPSGCGKSTMLDVLASTKNVGLIQGDVRLNGRPRDGHFRSSCAYVMQEDCCHKTLTVRETLFFTAALRLGPHVGREQRLARIRDTLADVDLTHVADTKIGDDVSGGLSGGQRRRVTIAIELISQPMLVLLDEPTSGLDAYGAQQVVSSLRRFADRGRTLACTIHQPRAETFALFHQLLLMKAGETMYCGPVAGITAHLGTCGVPCPPGVNPADLVVDLTHTKEKGHEQEEGEQHTASADELVDLFAKSELRRSIVQQLRAIEDGSDPDLHGEAPSGNAKVAGATGGGGEYPNSLWTQVGVLVRRQYTIDMRDFGYKFTWFFNGFVLALNASTYLLVAQPPLNAQPAPVYRDAFAASQICNLPASADSALFADAITCGETLVNVTSVEYASKGFLFLVINALFINEAVHVPSVMFDKRFFAREHGARAYSSLAWHLTWLIKLALTAAIKLILYTPCFYFLGQLRLDFTAYAAAAFATGGMSFAGSAVALLLAAVIPSLGAASTAFGCAVLLYQNVCGFFLPISAIPPYLIWLAWSSVFTYGYHAIMNSQQLGSAMTGGGSSIEERQVFTFNVLLFVWGLLFHGVAFLATRALHSKHACDLGRDGPFALASAKEGEEALKDNAAAMRWASIKNVALPDRKHDRWAQMLADVSRNEPPTEKIGRLRNLYLYLNLTAARERDTKKQQKSWIQG